MQKEILEKITITKEPGSLVVITGELPFEELEKHRESAVTAISKDIEIDGFRKGHVPEAVLDIRRSTSQNLRKVTHLDSVSLSQSCLI